MTLRTLFGVGTICASQPVEAVGIHLPPLSRYCIQEVRRGWLLGYAGYPEKELMAAARRLGKVWG
jgi:hypothetical protein